MIISIQLGYEKGFFAAKS